MKITLLRVRHFPASKFTPWMVAVPKSITGTKRVRKYFASQEEAGVYLTRLLAPGIGYAKADIRQQVPVNGEPGKPYLAQCADIWLKRFQLKKSSYFQNRQIITPLVTRHGRDPIDMVGVQQLDAWLRSLSPKYSLTTQHNYWRRTRQFFNFCHDFGYVASNPMKPLKEPKRRERLVRHLLTPEQMGQCLVAAKDDRALTAYLCLGGFAGCRTKEILRMDWDHIDWENGEVWVANPKETDDWHERYVEILPALRRHLEPLALKGAAIDAAAEAQKRQNGRPSRKIIPGGQRKLYEIRANLRKLLGVEEWPDNCLRHSFKSYHTAAFRNLELTRVEMGHSDSDTTKYKYGTARMKIVAEQWWAL
jgi:integrase